MARGMTSVSPETYEELGKPATLEAWHKALLLPDACRVIRVDGPEIPGTHGYYLILESDDIPERKLDALPRVELQYHREGDTIFFDRIVV